MLWKASANSANAGVSWTGLSTIHASEATDTKVATAVASPSRSNCPVIPLSIAPSYVPSTIICGSARANPCGSNPHEILLAK
jgi:hypothetical protein